MVFYGYAICSFLWMAVRQQIHWLDHRIHWLDHRICADSQCGCGSGGRACHLLIVVLSKHGMVYKQACCGGSARPQLDSSSLVATQVDSNNEPKSWCHFLLCSTSFCNSKPSLIKLSVIIKKKKKMKHVPGFAFYLYIAWHPLKYLKLKPVCF